MDNQPETTPTLPEEDSIAVLRQQVEAARLKPDLPGLSSALGALGRALLTNRNPLEGLTCFDEAVHIAQETGDAEAEARHLGNQGIALAQIGNYGLAVRSFRKAYGIAQRLGHPPLIYDTLIHIAELEKDRENYEGALSSLEEALQIAEEKGNEGPQLKVHLLLGNIHWKLEEFDPAVDHYQAALRLATALEDNQAKLESLHNLGALAKSRGETAQAVTYYQQAREIQVEGENPRLDLILWAQLGDALLDSGNIPQAMDAYHKALHIAHDLEDGPSEARLLGSLGIVQAELGDQDGSAQSADRAVALARETGQVQLLGEQLLLQAYAYYDLDRMDVAQSACLEAVGIFEKIEASSLLDRANDLLEEIQEQD
ncbi:MAG TPA: tetratricopeptide repeat protein [Anaerolineales bacterium]